ncbi:MAG: helix-turn-helix domain-containing protein [Paracoccaceae bacterium]
MTEITNFRGEATPTSEMDGLEADVHQLIQRVGARVRKARELKGLPRRVVSERSGVSPRYLAQLETGEGNISIGLLQRVAAALDCRIEWMVGKDDPWTSDALRIADLYRSATAGAPRGDGSAQFQHAGAAAGAPCLPDRAAWGGQVDARCDGGAGAPRAVPRA